MNDSLQRIYEFGEFRLSEQEKVLWRDGEPVTLTPKATETLLALVKNNGHIVSRENLMDTVWTDSFVEEHNINVCVSMLRKTLGSSFIETVPRRGYRFRAEVHEVFEENSADVLVIEKQTVSQTTIETEEISEPISTEKRISGAKTPTVFAFLKKYRIFFGVFFAVATLVGVFLIYRTMNTSEVRFDSIAVLPFSQTNADNEYLSDSVTENLINRLSKFREIRVASRTSVFEFKNKEISSDEIAKRLNVKTLLTGQVIQNGERLRIQTELIDIKNKSQIWGKQYEFAKADLQKIQNEIAGEVLKHLSLSFPNEQKEYQTSPEVYEAYLKGMEAINKSLPKEAIGHFDRAIALDANFALAYAGQSRAYSMLSPYQFPPLEKIAKTKEFALKALSLDDSLVHAHRALAEIYYRNEWKFDDAEREFKRTIELNPNDAGLYLHYSGFLSAIGRFEDAENAINQSFQIEPFKQRVFNAKAYLLLRSRRYDELLAHCEEANEIQDLAISANTYRIRAYWGKGEFDKAVELSKSLNSLLNDPTSTQLAVSYAFAGKKAEARREIIKIEEAYKERKNYCFYCLATIYAALGEKDKTFELLEKSYNNRDGFMPNLKTDMFFDSMRDDERYINLVRRIGFPN